MLVASDDATYTHTHIHQHVHAAGHTSTHTAKIFLLFFFAGGSEVIAANHWTDNFTILLTSLTSALPVWTKPTWDEVTWRDHVTSSHHCCQRYYQVDAITFISAIFIKSVELTASIISSYHSINHANGQRTTVTDRQRDRQTERQTDRESSVRPVVVSQLTAGSVIAKHERMLPSSNGTSQCRFCSSVPYLISSSMLPVSGAEQLNTFTHTHIQTHRQTDIHRDGLTLYNMNKLMTQIDFDWMSWWQWLYIVPAVNDASSLFITNMAISETKGQGWRAIPTQWRKEGQRYIHLRVSTQVQIIAGAF